MLSRQSVELTKRPSSKSNTKLTWR